MLGITVVAVGAAAGGEAVAVPPPAREERFLTMKSAARLVSLPYAVWPPVPEPLPPRAQMLSSVKHTESKVGTLRTGWGLSICVEQCCVS